MYDFKQIYHIICLLATIALVAWASYEYSLNEDETQIHINQFHKTAEDIYPSITICIDDPFIERKLKEIHPVLTNGTYKAFLGGKGWSPNDVDNEGMINIDYDNVTYQLEDIIDQFDLTLLENDGGDDDIAWSVKNNLLIREELVSGNSIKKYSTVSTIDTTSQILDPHTKCFTFDMPYIQDINIHSLLININASVFPSNPIQPEKEEFKIIFSYPNQLLQSRRKNEVIHDRKVSSTKCYRLDTYLGSMEVIRRRNKLGSRCNENWQNHDKDDLKNIMNKIGCNPKYWKMPSELPYCSNHTQYKAAIDELWRMSNSIPPCKSIEKLTQITYEFDQSEHCNNQLMLRILFNRETMYKEISLVRAFNMQSLIGNAGKELLR